MTKLTTNSISNDIDSPMNDASSTSSSSPSTPPPNINSVFTNSIPTGELSPPNSQQLHPHDPNNAPSPFTPLSTSKRSTSAAAASHTIGGVRRMPPSVQLNANGKRNWMENDKMATSNGDVGGLAGSVGPKDADGKDASYKWEREEDAPGWAWMNPKAKDEANRAWATVQDKDRRVGNKYGDVLLK